VVEKKQAMKEYPIHIQQFGITLAKALIWVWGVEEMKVKLFMARYFGAFYLWRDCKNGKC